LLVVLVALSSGLYAQQTTGSISGKIVDSTGAAIPDATITITNQSTLTGINLKSNAEGVYSSPPIDTGVYTIEVEREKFRPEAQKDFELNDSQRAEVNFSLKPGEVTDVVEVKGNAPLLNSFNAELGTVIDNKTAEALPLNGSNALAMVQMNPAVVSAGSAVNEGFNDRGVGVSNIRIGSGLPGSNANLLDGQNNLQTTRSDILINATITGMAATKVQYGIISADYGFTSGGIITMSTKSGTEQYHGMIYDYYRNNIFNAKNHFAVASTNPTLRYNQYGAGFGGPALHNKLYFFGNYEAYKLTQGESTQITIPTAKERTGDFSDQLGTTAAGLPEGMIYDPTTCTLNTAGTACTSGTRLQFVSTPATNPACTATSCPNMIPTAAMDPAAVAFQNAFVPLPNVPPASATALQNSYINDSPLIASQTVSVGRIDWQVSNRLSLFARYGYYENITNNEGSYGGLAPIASTRNDDLKNQAFAIGITQVISGTKLNDIRVAIGRSFFPYAAGSAGQNWPQKLGMTGVPQTTIPSLSMSNYGMTDSTNFGVRTSTIPEFDDTISILHGPHSIHFGGAFRFYEALNNYNTEPSGEFSFSSSQTDQSNNTALTGNPYASFLVGKTASVSAQVTGTSVVRSFSVSGFFQDDWRVNSRLTLNLGLRYDYQAIPWEKHNGFSTLRLNMVNPTNGLMGTQVYAGVNGQGRNFAEENYHDAGPRIGFAYLVSEKHHTVLRGGYALYYAASYNSMYQNATDAFGSTTTLFDTSNIYSYVSQFDAGYPGTPLGVPGVKGGPNFFLGSSPTVQPVYAPTSASQQFVLSIDHEFSKNTVLSIMAMQNHGTHFPMTSLNLNQLNPKYFSLGGVQAIGASTGTSVLLNYTDNPFYNSSYPTTNILGNKTMTVMQALKPYPYFSTIYEFYPHIGSYLGRNVQALVRRPITTNLQMQIGYNFGRFFSDPLIAAISSPASITASLQDNYAPHSEYSIDPTDVTHNMTGNMTYQLPFGKNQRFFNNLSERKNRMVGNWTIANTMLIQSGRPLAFTGGGNAESGTANRPSFVPGASVKVAHPSSAEWFNINAFEGCPALNNTNPFCFGNVPRTYSKVRGPSTVNINTNLMKTVTYGRYSLQFQASAFNVLNKTNYNSPNTGYSTSTTTTFGSITSAAQARTLQFTGRLMF
jgi:hypothetical protein